MVAECLGGSFDSEDALMHFWLAASAAEKKLRRYNLVPVDNGSGGGVIRAVAPNHDHALFRQWY